MDQDLAPRKRARRGSPADRADGRPAGRTSPPRFSDTVTVAMGFDGIYAPHAAAVLASIVAHAPGAHFRFIMLYAEVAEPMKRMLERVALGSEFIWREVREDETPKFRNRAHLTRATLFRLGLETMAPTDCRRVIYLDVDLIVRADLRYLWTADLGDAVVGAVRDGTIDANAFADRFGLPQGPGYFNAGVLVIDLDRVRKQRLFSAAIAFLSAHEGQLKFFDQDALNFACWGRWRPLDLVWNVQRNVAIDYSLGQKDLLGGALPRIVHYTTGDKPWTSGGYHPWHWLYWEAQARTELFNLARVRAGVGPVRLFQLWFRWMRKRPKGAVGLDAAAQKALPARVRLSLQSR